MPVSVIFKFPLPYWQPQPSPPNYSPNPQPFLNSPFILGGMKHLHRKFFFRGYETFCAIPENRGMKHFPKAKGRVRNILIFYVVRYETFPPLTMKTLQQGMHVKKWTAPMGQKISFSFWIYLLFLYFIIFLTFFLLITSLISSFRVLYKMTTRWITKDVWINLNKVMTLGDAIGQNVYRSTRNWEVNHFRNLMLLASMSHPYGIFSSMWVPRASGPNPQCWLPFFLRSPRANSITVSVCRTFPLRAFRLSFAGCSWFIIREEIINWKLKL